MATDDWWYKFYIARYRADTGHLTMEQHGIYRALIDHYMETQKGLHDHPVALASAARCDVGMLEKNWPVLRGFFTLERNLLKLKRCEFLITGRMALREKKSDIGAKGGKAKAENQKKKLENKQNSSSCQKPFVPEEIRGEETTEEKNRIESSLSKLEAEMYFSRVWEAYPAWSGKDGGYQYGSAYKGSRQKALDKFYVLLKKEKDHEQFTRIVLNACEAYRAILEHDQWRASAHLITWLNQGRWLDDYSLPEGGRGGGSSADAIAQGFGQSLRNGGEKG